ncbi:hypothetical protein RclHR1_15220004 [Rhizophagus clarus]|uniref:Uncharacterized protein n=1 Tax=Rhizophagus clarus TaxID=94130 RepID=A0A2Z6QEN2_9GLOM|nr:hypothetical protein RclHR1_15220004 [Rhizophagus clarus]
MITDELPVGVLNWCLNQKTLKRFNRPTNNIPVYDYDTGQEDDNGNHSDTEDDYEEENRANSNKRKRKKTKKKSKKKGEKRSINQKKIKIDNYYFIKL